MGNLSIAASRDHFQKDGRPWFYLADTVWSAFTNATDAQWAEYLDFRREQGFNALQINILPQWDRSLGARFPEPFRADRQGRWDFSAPGAEYFQRARTMTAEAHRRGFVPGLVFLWCNHVAGTWAAARKLGALIRPEEVEGFAAFACATFGEFDPIWLASGDTDFKDPATLTIYLAALRAIRAHAPQALTTLHLNPDAALPAEIVQSADLGFYMYQSGHHPETQNRSWRLAEQALAYPVKRPVLNGEPCYEGIQYYQQYGRFSAFDVRRSIWQSLLSGAKAGVTYGAHGLWSWHGPGLTFPHTAVWNQPFPWQEALRLPGAADAAFAKWVFERYCLHELEPARELLDPATPPEIRVAASADRRRLTVYAPYATAVRLRLDDTGLDWQGLNLRDRRVFRPAVRGERGGIVVEPASANADALFVAESR